MKFKLGSLYQITAFFATEPVKVRYDPFDVSIGYAYLDGRWRKCITPYNEFEGCSERELQLLTAELRKRHRLLSGKEHIELTQKQLASFWRENTEIETLLRQQRHDRETRAARVVLEGGKSADVETSVARPASAAGKRQHNEDTLPASSPQAAEKRHDKLLVFRRIPR